MVPVHTDLEAPHALPSATALCWHPFLASHASTLQSFPSSQSLALATFVQFPFGYLHVSTVHFTPSLQRLGVPAHSPLSQVSLIEQTSPSSHAVPDVTSCAHPFSGSQLSIVQALRSLQSVALTALPQAPLVQSAVPSHGLSDKQELAAATSQPDAGVHVPGAQSIPVLHVALDSSPQSPAAPQEAWPQGVIRVRMTFGKPVNGCFEWVATKMAPSLVFVVAAAKPTPYLVAGDHACTGAPAALVLTKFNSVEVL